MVARELYGLPAGEFIDARNAHSKRARSAGEKDAAREVLALRKPTTAAWLVNQLTRTAHEEVRLLLDLGAELRAGMSDVDAGELRLLTRRRYQLVSALVQRAGEMSISHGRRVSDEVLGAVRTTLEATLADAESASLVASGCLTDGLQVSGFGFGGSSDVAGALDPALSVDTSNPVADLGERRRLRDEQVTRAAADVASADAAARESHERLEEVQARLDEVDEQRAEAARVVQRLERELAQATAALEHRTAMSQEHRREHETTASSVRRADRELADTEARLRKLKR